MWKGAAIAVLLLVPGGAQVGPPPAMPGYGVQDELPIPRKLHRKQIDQMLKADHQRNLAELAVLIKLSEELRSDWRPGEDTERKLDEIGRLAGRVRTRLRKF